MRNEDYDRELLAAVTLICVVITAAASLFESPRPSAAVRAAPGAQAASELAPVRIVGAPFVPNTNPSMR